MLKKSFNPFIEKITFDWYWVWSWYWYFVWLWNLDWDLYLLIVNITTRNIYLIIKKTFFFILDMEHELALFVVLGLNNVRKLISIFNFGI